MRQLFFWTGAALLLALLLPHGADTDLRFSSALAQESQPLFIGDVLNPLAFGQPITAHEIPTERTEKAAVFDLGGKKRAAISNGSPLFTEENGTWIPIEQTGHLDGDAFAFDRLAEGVDISFDLTKPSYTLMQNGQGFTVRFSGDASGKIIDDRSIEYVLADGVTLRWTVDGNHVHKDIRVEKTMIAQDIGFTLTPSGNLHLQRTGDSLSLMDADDAKIFVFDAPFLAGADGVKITNAITLKKSGNQYQYVFDESALSLPYVIDPSSGPNSPGTLADDSSVGAVAWSNPTNAATSNNSYATAVLTRPNNELPGDASHYLKATNFGFSIPSGATIDGIVAEVERDSTNWVMDGPVKLVKSGTIQGDDKAVLFVDWDIDSEVVVSYGGNTDLWGLTLTDSDINASNFGFAFSGINDTAGGDATALVDHMRITVYYTGGAGGAVDIPVFPPWSLILLLPGGYWIIRRLQRIEA